jgi:hypothetical protein
LSHVISDTPAVGHPFDAQARPEGPIGGHQVWHEGFQDGLAEQGLLLPVRFFQSRSKRESVSNVGIRHCPNCGKILEQELGDR